MNDAPNRATSSRLPASVGEVINGKYLVESILGAGGMGIVLGAVHVKLQQPVALKFLLPEVSEDELTRARFDREGRAVAQIESEHVARVMDVESLPDGTPFLVLERLSGRDLADIMDAEGAFAPEEAVALVLEACDAIAEAHAAGIVHRDIKPENLFLAERADGSRIVKVIDFGISKVDAASAAFVATRGSAVTRTTSVVGSPMYMSPEQLRSARDVDGRSDVWSLAVTLYELVSAQAPFPWGTVPEVCASVLKDEPVPLEERAPALPKGLCAAIHRALEKDRDARWPDVASFAVAISPFGGPRAEALVDRIVRVSQRPPRQVSATSEVGQPSAGSPIAEGRDALEIPRRAFTPDSQRLERVLHETIVSDIAVSDRSPSLRDAPPAVLSTRVGRRGVKARVLGVGAAVATLASLGAFARPHVAVPVASHSAPFVIWIARSAAGDAARTARATDAEAILATPVAAPSSLSVSANPRLSRPTFANASRAFEHRK